MTTASFWELIEEAWQEHPALLKKRDAAVAAGNEKALTALADAIEDSVIEGFENRLYDLERDELISFIHILEERLYHIDRSEIQEATDGSDDGFLYARCYIVAMGEAYYNAVDKDPSKAAMDAEAEGFGFTAYSVYADRYDEQFPRNSKHNIESGSNKAGWS